MTINLNNTFKKYKGSWVALKQDQSTVVASAKTIKEVLGRAKANGFEDPILFKVPTKVIAQIGYA